MIWCKIRSFGKPKLRKLGMEIEVMVHLDKNIYSILLLCENFYRSNKYQDKISKSGTMYNLVKDGLSSYLRGLSIVHEGLYPGWKADLEHPGYLIRLDPPAIMRAPYHIIPAFPSEAALDGIWDLSRRIKTLDNSVICLSGSGAVLKSSILISDFDFCEYIHGDTTEIARALVMKGNTENQTVFKSLKFNNHTWMETSSDTVENTLKTIDPAIRTLSSAKIDFLAKARGFRPCEVSNLIIFCDEEFESASLEKTFSTQEAQIDASTTVPNNICEPFEIGRYMYWLRIQVDYYIKKGNYVKALKRLISLSRFCFIHEISESITKYISKSPECLKSEFETLEQILSLIRATEFECKIEWEAEIIEAKNKISDEIVTLEKFPDTTPISFFTQDIFDQISSMLSGNARAA